jgi:DNA-binding IclR family transcriptional regulator
VFAAFLPERETIELRDRELAARQHSASDYQPTLAAIRERGLHHVHGLLMPGVDALSAPVFNAMGQVAAVMTVVGPTSIFHADEQGPAAERLLAATRETSWRMGYSPT